jgi:hypothetical protein
MKIKFSTWLCYCRIVGCLAVPLALLNEFGPYWWSLTDQNITLGFFTFVGLFGALAAVLLRMGKIEFTYSEKDRKKLTYKMAKSVAEREQDSPFGKLFSPKYYNSFDNSQAGESDGKNSS